MILAREKEVLIGGAAGGSKSTSLLMRALFYVQDDVNEYHALILRRALSDLKRKGALIHKASQWLNRKEVQNNASIKPKWDGTEHSWTFPNGNSLTFGYLRNINDLDTYRGSEYQFIGIDELTQLERFKYIYMRSRVRKTKDNKLPTQLMCSSNPGKRGNKWVRERFIEKIDTDIQDKSQIRFISSSYLDNVYLDRKDYEEYLMGLDRVTREQLMNGNWYASVKGQLFDESDFHLISHDEYMKIPIVRVIRYWDLAATKGGFETVEKLDKYLILFEFVTAFNFIILLSGLPDDVYQKFKQNIWNAKNPKIYEDMTFGKWVILTENISKIYNENDFTSKVDNELFNKISSPKIIKILNKAKDYRNELAHGSFINSYEAQDIIDELDIYLEDIFDILEVYSDYKLVYITGVLDTSGGKLNHQVIQLNGPCAQPIYENIIFDKVLTAGYLYLYNPKNNKKLLINDDFMKFKSTDENNKHWALFIYYKCERIGYMQTNAHYKCFQSKEEDIIESISTFENDIMK